MRRRWIIVAVVVVSLAGLAFFVFSGPAPYPLSAQPATAHRVLPMEDRMIWSWRHGPEPDRPIFRDYRVFASKPMPAELRIALVRILESRDSYVDPGHGGACFVPRLGFSFGEGRNCVELLICLQCHWVYFYKGNSVRYKALSPRGVAELAPIAEALFGADARPFTYESPTQPAPKSTRAE